MMTFLRILCALAMLPVRAGQMIYFLLRHIVVPMPRGLYGKIYVHKNIKAGRFNFGKTWYYYIQTNKPWWCKWFLVRIEKEG